jgi:RNA polymerase sigma-70 factor, ECF subfamily
MTARALEVEAVDPLVVLIREGAYREAIGRCARDHGSAIGRLCMAFLGSQAEAEEVTQETLIAAHDAMAQFRGDGTVRAWLFGIARRKCARRLATQVRRENRLRLVHDVDSERGGPDESLDARRRAERLREALAALRPTEREAVILRYQAGLAYREVAEACGIEETAARKRVSRALDRLRELMRDSDDRARAGSGDGEVQR